MEWAFTVVTRDDVERDVVLEADESAPLSAVAAALANYCGMPSVYTPYGEDGSRLEPETRLGDAPLRDGYRIWLDAPPAASWQRRRPPALHLPPEYARPGRGGTISFTRPPRVRAPELQVPELQPLGRLGLLPGLGRLVSRRSVNKVVRKVEENVREHNAHVLPGPGELPIRVQDPHPRLWERRRSDPDFLALRLGVEKKSPRVVLPVDLKEVGVLGVSGASRLTRMLGSWLVAQLALLHSPADLGIRILTDAPGAWNWARWLPGVRSTGSAVAEPHVSHDEDGHRAQLTAVLDELAKRSKTGRSGDTPAHRSVVLVLDDERLADSDVERLCREGPAAGIYVIVLGAAEALRAAGVPMGLVRRNSSDVDVTYEPPPPEAAEGPEQTDRPQQEGASARRYVLRADRAFPGWLDEIARAVAPVRPAESDTGDNRPLELPGHSPLELLGHSPREAARFVRRPNQSDTSDVRLLELLDDSPPEAADFVRYWHTTPDTTAVVGWDGARFAELDLTRDGPHALVAGAPRSGKTEFLCTLVASLAMHNRPDETAFLLVDPQDGPAFRELAELPHCVGLFSEFGERELESLGAELRRREQQLTAAGARDIDDYARLRRRSPSGSPALSPLPPLPRLVIVLHELPYGPAGEQVLRGLTSVAQRGRSLGVHLVVGAQLPFRSTIPRDLLAGLNLRVAFRTLSTAGSEEVIGEPYAAWLGGHRAGSAYIRSGPDGPRLVRTARVRVRARTADGSHSVYVRPFAAYDSLHPEPFALDIGPASGGLTDLRLLSDALREAARTAGVAPPPPPVLPQLKVAVSLTEVEPPQPGPEPGDVAPLAFGLEDVPDEQAQRPALFDLARDGSLLVLGGPRSGRSQTLRTFAAAAARQYSAADVHLYAFDGDDGALDALAGLPHCGAVVPLRRTEPAARLLDRLTATVRRRRELLAEGGFRDVAEQRRAVDAPQRMPYLLVLVRGREGHFDPELRTLLRDGERAGVCTVLTGDSFALADLLAGPDADPHRLAVPARQLVLPRADSPDDDRSDVVLYAELLSGAGPGRAVDPATGRLTQIALLPGPATRRAQADALAAYAAEARARDREVPAARRPFRIEDAPLVADQFHVGSGKGRPVGREDVLAWLLDRHATGSSVALLGPRRAGKTWVLAELEGRLREAGARAVRPIVVLPSGGVADPDALARLLDRSLPERTGSAQELLDKVAGRTGPERVTFLLDEIGRLVNYDPAVVSWLRDVGQAGAWLVYTGTEKDWHSVVRWALTAPGSSFGNDVNARLLGPLERGDALGFLTGTAANLGVDIVPERTGAALLDLVGTWPFYLQVVGDAVVRAVQANSPAPLDDPTWLAGLVEQRLLDEWTHHFRSRWAEIDRAGRAALLQEPGRTPTGAARAQRNDLREVGLLRPGDVWLADRPFFDWIARNATKLRDEESGA